MSWLWNIMLSFSDDEYWLEGVEEVLEAAPPLENINQWLNLEGGALTDLTLGSGGAGLNANLFGGGFKHFDIESFIGIVASQEWQCRDDVQLFIKDEEAQTWTLVNLSQTLKLFDE